MATAKTQQQTTATMVGQVSYSIGNTYLIPIEQVTEKDGFNAREVSPDMVDDMAISLEKLGQISAGTCFLPDENAMFPIETGHTRYRAILQLTRKGVKIPALWNEELQSNCMRLTIAPNPPAGRQASVHAFLRNIAENEIHNSMSPRDKARAIVRAESFDPPVSAGMLATHMRVTQSDISRLRKIADLVPALQDLLHVRAIVPSAVWLCKLDTQSEDVQSKLATWIYSETDIDPITLRPGKMGEKYDQRIAKVTAAAITEKLTELTKSPAVQPPKIVDFAVTGGKALCVSENGDKRGLKWTVENAETVTLNGSPAEHTGFLAESIVDFSSVVPDAKGVRTISYTLTATNKNGKAEQVRVFTLKQSTTPLGNINSLKTDTDTGKGTDVDDADDFADGHPAPDASVGLDGSGHKAMQVNGGHRATNDTLQVFNTMIAALDNLKVTPSNLAARALRIVTKYLEGTVHTGQFQLEYSQLCVESQPADSGPKVKATHK